jgi:hypothetical protein
MPMGRPDIPLAVSGGGLRAAEQRVTELRAAQGQQSQAEESKSSSFRQSPSVNGKAIWDTLIIPQSLREKSAGLLPYSARFKHAETVRANRRKIP